ncbi:winged helix-turn-helix domain-containing protein (plasmid) [Cyanobacterium sp. IPPAS B-1200]|uniref:winged helix-turn-helix domain-containing protein n=1 Tax=Cyanobacterium sp. IPPAS B-1200 TaxID=1562720 RepID=UPI003D40E4C0
MSERLVEIIREYPQGCTAIYLSQRVNRPISMINIYLKGLISTKQVRTRINKNTGKRLIYSRS